MRRRLHILRAHKRAGLPPLDGARKVCDSSGMFGWQQVVYPLFAGALACGGEGSGSSEKHEGSSGTSLMEPETGGVTGGEVSVSWELIRYTQQPMVVDVVLTTSGPATTIELAHTEDSGVMIEAIAREGFTTRLRVRGLAPDREHVLVYKVDGVEGLVEFITYPPLLGFMPEFEVAGGPVDPAVPYRMFDLIPFPAFNTAGVFMVDAAGTTRWHLGGASTGIAGPEGIWTSVRLREDGSIMYLHEYTMWIRDELGAPLLELSDEMLGVTGLHHELLELPSGNFMALSFSFQEVDYGPAGVLTAVGDRIVEFTRAGEVVWTWDSFDHLDPQRVREPFAAAMVPHPVTKAPTYDWTHGNGLVYTPEKEMILLSLRHQDWIVAIDHKSGAVLWKLGNDGDFTLSGAAKFFHHQHAPEWQPDGSLLLYDNGVGDPDLAPMAVQSRARRYELDLAGKTAKLVWSDDGEPIRVPFAGNADRLPGGRILVTDSSIVGGLGYWARLRELEPSASPMVQWSLRTPDGSFAYRASAHARLVGQVGRARVAGVRAEGEE